MRRAIFSILLFLSILNSKNIVAVTIPPQEFILEKLGGKDVEIFTLVEAGNSPHTYEPKPSQMLKLTKAKRYFAIGVEFENVWLSRFTSQNRDLKIIHTDRGIPKITMGRGGKFDPHIWLDPISLKVVAKNMTDGLIEMDSNRSEVFKSNLKKVEMELNQLDRQIRETLKGIRKRDFLVFHPSWGYFAKRYGLHQISIEFEGKKPSFKEIVQVVKMIKERGIKVVFVHSQASYKQAEIVAKELDLKIVPVSTMERDVYKNLLFMAQEIAKANR
jgi:zinc transport system substrate-binding protein